MRSATGSQRRVLGRLFEEGKRETSLVLDAGIDDAPRPVSVESDRLGLCARRLYERSALAGEAPEKDRDLAGLA